MKRPRGAGKCARGERQRALRIRELDFGLACKKRQEPKRFKRLWEFSAMLHVFAALAVAFVRRPRAPRRRREGMQLLCFAASCCTGRSVACLSISPVNP